MSLMGASRTNAPMSTQPSSALSGMPQKVSYGMPFGMTTHFSAGHPIPIWMLRALVNRLVTRNACR